MLSKSIRCLLVAVLSLIVAFFSNISVAQVKPPAEQTTKDIEKHEEKKGFDANEVIFGHVLDAHEFHFLSYKSSDGQSHHATIPLPVILYSPQRGFTTFMSSAFHHGEHTYKGYDLLTTEKILERKLDPKKYSNGQIVPVTENGELDTATKVYDVSLTRNVVQMLLSLVLLVVLMTNISKKYKKGFGVTSAPNGFQNAVEPIITFVRDEVARPNLGPKTDRYMPFLLTAFFFILINNIVGLIPGTANVTGNIAFTIILGLLSFIAILVSSNKHYWKHIFWPPVPGGIKPIMILVEFIGIFTKPFALIIRLFANMIAGHIIIICLISLIFIFGGINTGVGWGFSPISIGFTVFIYFIEILVAFLQAYIFTNLTAVFIGQAIEDPHHGVGHDDAVIV